MPGGPTGDSLSPLGGLAAAARSPQNGRPPADTQVDLHAAAAAPLPPTARPSADTGPDASASAPATAPAPQDILAALAGASAATSPSPNTLGLAPQGPVTTLAVPTPLSAPQWAQDFGRRIAAFAQSGANGLHTVQLHVNPPELGPVHILLQIGDATTQAAFVSPHAHVRQALENALPRLEQQFAQSGLSLGQASVSDQQAGQQAFQQSDFTSSRGGSGTLSGRGMIASASPGLPTDPRTTAVPRRPDALVDTFV
ncbi:hypothetical protein CDEF62S_03919 [Castellaniella defragrans]